MVNIYNRYNTAPATFATGFNCEPGIDYVLATDYATQKGSGDFQRATR